MITRNSLTLASITLALLLGTTGCTLIGNGPENGNTPTAGNTTTTAPVETTTPAEPTETPTAIALNDAATIREGIYLDEWAKNVTGYYQRAANTHLHENESTLSPGDLQAFIDERIAADTPDAFEVKATTTAFNNFTINVWHPNAHTHRDESTAYIASSDPQVTSSTPTPTPTPSDPAQQLDAEAPEILYTAALWAISYMDNNNGEVPTDMMLRITDSIPDGWEWEIRKNEFYPEYFVFKVWNSEAFLYNSPENAATYDNHPKPEMRPSYNVDVKPYIPIMDASIPLDELTPVTPSPTETPFDEPLPSETPPPFDEPSPTPSTSTEGVNA